MQDVAGEGRAKKIHLKRIVRSGAKIVGIAAMIAVIFMTGVGVGNGSIRFQDAGTPQNKDLPEDLDYSSVERLYDVLKADYDGKLDVQKLLDGMKTGLAEASGDPYTVYLNAKDAKEFNEQLTGTFSGVGAELGQDESGNLIIVAPIAGFPASRAGLRPQDLIIEIDGKSTAGMNVPEAVAKIRGPKGTKVTLRVLRDKKEDLSFTITREDIKVPSVKYELLDGGVGYIQITQFNGDTDQLLQEAAEDFKDKNVTGLVVDLRGNPGGLLSASVEASSLWLKNGQVVLQERRGGIVTASEFAHGEAVFAGMPTAVLIDEGSASASEIMAGALKDHKVAKLFGAKSFGKGSVQQIEKLAGGSELKVTVARWYRPSGENIDKKGIKPDIEVKLSEDDIKNKRDPQKDAAVTFIKNQ